MTTHGEAAGMRFWEECSAFYGEFRRQFYTTGSILPSSRFLAEALAAGLRPRHSPARILEVGPGTGSVTCAIARHMGPHDQLEAVEINERFAWLVEGRLRSDPAFAHCRQRARVIQGALQDLPGEGTYDFIVSGLPFNNFPVPLVGTIFATYHRLLRPGGLLSFFEYTMIRELKAPFVGRAGRERLAGIGRVVAGYIRRYQVRQKQVLINVPPATVRYLRFQSAPDPV
jgi:phospholipid N-methyltransferase